MAANIENQFWKLRSKHGRDKIFSSPEVLLQQSYEYFANCDNNPWFKNEGIKNAKVQGISSRYQSNDPTP